VHKSFEVKEYLVKANKLVVRKRRDNSNTGMRLLQY